MLKEEDKVDLTPMIDVTFLLLIYFMVTTMLKQPESELSIQLPGKPQNSDVNPMPMLEVRIGDEGEVYMNGSEIEDGPKLVDGKWVNLEMPDLVDNLKSQKGIRDQMIAGGRPKEEAEVRAKAKAEAVSRATGFAEDVFDQLAPDAIKDVANSTEGKQTGGFLYKIFFKMN